MKKIFLNCGLYISSFIPLYFLIVVKELIEIANNNLRFNITNTIMIILNCLFIVFGIFATINYINKPYNKIKVLQIKNITEEKFLPSFPLFVLFCIAYDLQFIAMSVIYLLVLIMIGIVYVKNKIFYINPFFNILGFGLYEITFENGKTTQTQKVFCRKIQLGGNYNYNGLFIKPIGKF